MTISKFQLAQQQQQQKHNNLMEIDEDYLEEVERRHVEERREVRKDYRRLLVDTEERKQEFVRGSASEIIERLNEANHLYNKVEHSTEAILDSKLLAVTSELGAQHMRSARSDNSSIDMSEVIGNIRHFMGASRVPSMNDQAEDEDLDWKSVAVVATKYARTAPSIKFILGPLSIEIKQKKQSARSALQIPAVSESQENYRQPEQLQLDDIQQDENETLRNIQEVHRILHTTGPTLYWKFVINPNSFSQSVENIFYCAFLAKEGRVIIGDSADCNVRYPDVVIEACEQLPEEQRSRMPKYQYMVSFDMKCWRDLIEKYDIQSSAIPSRPPSSSALDPTGRTW